MDRGGFACLCRSRCRIEFESWVDPGFVMPRYCAFRGCRKQVRKKFCAAHRPKEDGDGDGNEEQSRTVVGDTLAAKGPPKKKAKVEKDSKESLDIAEGVGSSGSGAGSVSCASRGGR